MQYWLLKSERDCYSIDEFKNDTEKKQKVPWTGIRNYQARNFMRDQMKVGDKFFFYHSGKDPEIVGIGKITGVAHPDLTAFDKNDDHYDPKSTKENPIWMCVDVSFVKKLSKPVLLAAIKFEPALKGIMVAQQGSRLSVQPVSENHFNKIVEMAK
jgi:predicted RNA-binding protein with PUA-like domain